MLELEHEWNVDAHGHGRVGCVVGRRSERHADGQVSRGWRGCVRGRGPPGCAARELCAHAAAVSEVTGSLLKLRRDRRRRQMEVSALLLLLHLVRLMLMLHPNMLYGMSRRSLRTSSGPQEARDHVNLLHLRRHIARIHIPVGVREARLADPPTTPVRVPAYAAVPVSSLGLDYSCK